MTTAITPRRMTALAPRRDQPFALPPRAAPPQQVRGLVTGMMLLALFLVFGLGSWATLAPMQGAVLAAGEFGVLGDRLVIQHLEGGIVHDIAVREGDSVETGQVIARLDDTRPRASLSILQNQLASILATQARLHSQADGIDQIVAPPELSALLAADPGLHGVLQAQQDLLTADRALLTGRESIVGSRIAQLTEQRAGLEQRVTALTAQLDLLQQELRSTTTLVEKGLATRNGLLEARRDEASLLGDIASAHAALLAADRQISEQQENKLQVNRDAAANIADQLQQSGQTLGDLRQRIGAAQDVLDRTIIRAPRAGRVVGLKLNTLGQVINPGESIAEILPDTTNFVVEVLIKPDDINEVHTGGSARVRLTAFNFRTTPTVQGTVTRVSPDSLLDAESGRQYYHALIELDPGALQALPDVTVVPGMQAQVMIATGKRTLADYLLGPILSGVDKALRDEI